MRIYLSLDQKTGRFFEYSKEEKEGWEKHTYTSKDGGTTKVTYRNYYLSGVRGVFKGIKLQDGKFGDQFQVGLEEEGITRILSFPYKGQKGFHDDNFLVPFLKVLPNMQMGEVYTVKAYRFTPTDSIYEKSGVKVEDEVGESLDWALSESYVKKTGEVVEGDIPPKKFKKNRTTKKSEIDMIAFAARTEYLDAVVEKILEQKPADFGSIASTPNMTSADVNRGTSSPSTEENHVQESKESSAKVEDTAEEKPEVKQEEHEIKKPAGILLPF